MIKPVASDNNIYDSSSVGTVGLIFFTENSFVTRNII